MSPELVANLNQRSIVVDNPQAEIKQQERVAGTSLFDHNRNCDPRRALADIDRQGIFYILYSKLVPIHIHVFCHAIKLYK